MPTPDYYELDALLTEDERITRDTVRTFVEHECMPLLEGCGHTALVVTPPNGFDLNDWASHYPAWPDEIRNAIAGIDPVPTDRHVKSGRSLQGVDL